MTTSELETPLFDATTRCDRCGARAMVWAEMPGDLELLFCNHHYNENAEKILAVATKVHAQ